MNNEFSEDIDKLLSLEDDIKKEISKNNKINILFYILIVIAFILSFVNILDTDNDGYVIGKILAGLYTFLVDAFFIYFLIQKQQQYEDNKNFYSRYLIFVRAYVRRNYNIHLDISIDKARQDYFHYSEMYRYEDILLPWLQDNDIKIRKYQYKYGGNQDGTTQRM